jgi:hypothetical protein
VKQTTHLFSASNFLPAKPPKKTIKNCKSQQAAAVLLLLLLLLLLSLLLSVLSVLVLLLSVVVVVVLLLLLLLELLPALLESALQVRIAAHHSCWKGHLPSHNIFPIRCSARPFDERSGHSLLECAAFECRELHPNLVESTRTGVRTDVHLNYWEHLPSHNPFRLRRSARGFAFDECSGHSLLESAAHELRAYQAR